MAVDRAKSHRVVMLASVEYDGHSAEIVRLRRPDWHLEICSSRAELLEAVLERPAMVLIDASALPIASLQRTIHRLKIVGAMPVILGTRRAVDGCPMLELSDDWTILDTMLLDASR
ncbi:hypothetical protein CLV49_2560 [Labedella gwakjiensis]|uniref:Response regulatory domain-containing protein n=1 Tax=Labedella gwakjiensis TaxID=390269 RepID=A0A2P8GY88_9MICO|nr:hypothetical protein [Labedella gwakjiensis]PSL38929.1 hypothetical protein CLV49_2560 [Labedella gwakjiensis]RUQ86609.1 hypothetical protein ELQ93_06425 [Labedella gwakjiensis]